MTDQWKSYTATDGTEVLQHVDAPTTVTQLLERRGLHRAQIVQNAAGTEHYTLTDLIGEAWQLADFAARHDLVPRLAALQAERDQLRAQLRARELYGPRDND